MKLRSKLVTSMLVVLIIQTSISALFINIVTRNQNRIDSEQGLLDGWRRQRSQIENLKHQLFVDINLLTVYFYENSLNYLRSVDIRRTLDYFLGKTRADAIILRDKDGTFLLRSGDTTVTDSILNDLGVKDEDFRFPRNIFYAAESGDGDPALYLITGTTLRSAGNEQMHVFFINSLDSGFLAVIRLNTGIDLAFFMGSEFIASSTAGFHIPDSRDYSISRLMIGNTPYKVLPGILSADIDGGLYMVALESADRERLYVRSLQTAFSIAFIVAFIAAFIMTALLTSYFISPFQHLNQWLHRYRETGVVEELKLHTKDEVGFLADTFYYIVKKIIDEERIIRQQWEQLLVAEKISSLGILSAGMAHEINNPLGSILSHVNYLTAVEGDPEKLDSLEWIGRETNRIAGIISRLLAYSKKGAETGRNCNLTTIVEETVALLAHEFKRNGIHIVKDMSVDGYCVHIPEDEAKQVILNLTLNAMQAIGENGTIEYRTEDRDGFVRLTVRDDGSGIPADNLSKVFDPFFTTKRDGSATGFGLSISFKLVSNAGGTMSIESSEGAGTIVEVLLPCS